MSVKEKKQDKLLKLRFDTRIVPKSTSNLANSKMLIRIQEIISAAGQIR